MRILVVDDAPAVRTSLERALRIEDYDVELANEGRDALGRLPSVAPDAVVLDVLMPFRSGTADRPPSTSSRFVNRRAVDDRLLRGRRAYASLRHPEAPSDRRTPFASRSAEQFAQRDMAVQSNAVTRPAATQTNIASIALNIEQAYAPTHQPFACRLPFGCGTRRS